MKISKQARRDGKSLFRACFAGGQLDESRVRDAVSKVIAAKPRGYLRALTHFQRLLKLHLDSRTARIENAVESSPELQAGLESALTRRYGPGLHVSYWINPQLLGGLRVRVGSDVYDGSVRARLESMKNAL
ncbi:MAG: F0F1 ATP synthase subunit delta [Verrucomicrobiales bacterium]|nr:F0F1 ATP synthase subunit delta [Verrucomicrobiales bacterium]